MLRDFCFCKGLFLSLILLILSANVFSQEINCEILDSPPIPPKQSKYNIVTKATLPSTAVILDQVPTSRWTYGCSATAAGMLFGYYDRVGYSNMYSGPCNEGIAPISELGQGRTPGKPYSGSCSIIASENGFDGRNTRGHVDDYWIDVGEIGPDPWEGNWSEHSWDCIADFLGTNQWKWDTKQDGSKNRNSDGGTTSWSYNSADKLYDKIPPASMGTPQTALCHGLRLFAESRGYSVVENYTQLVDSYFSGGFSFLDYMNEINNGRPVLFNMRSDSYGHTVTGVGYNESSQTIYFHDGWHNDLQSMSWGGIFSEMSIKSAVVMKLVNIDPPYFINSGFSVEPENAMPGQQLEIYYDIYNPNNFEIMVGVGCSIKKDDSGDWLSDPSNDEYVVIPAYNSYYGIRQFVVPSDAESGSYDVACGLWSRIGNGPESLWDYLEKEDEMVVESLLSTRFRGDHFVDKTAKIGIPVLLEAKLERDNWPINNDIEGETVSFEIYYSGSWHEISDDAISGTSLVTDDNGIASLYYSPSKNLDEGSYSIRARYDGSSTYDSCIYTSMLNIIRPNWLVMVYLCADNDLEEFSIVDFYEEMWETRANNEVSLCVLYDRSSGHSTEHSDWTSTRFYRFCNDTLIYNDWGEENLGSPNVLQTFIETSLNYCDADHVSLILWNHGSGWKSIKSKSKSNNQNIIPELEQNIKMLPKQKTKQKVYDNEYEGFKAVCSDDTGDRLLVQEIRDVLDSVTGSGQNKIDLLGFDACLMGMVEVAYDSSFYADYFVASEDTESADGWEYQNILNTDAISATTTAEQWGQTIVEQSIQETLGCWNLSEVSTVFNEVDRFAESLSELIVEDRNIIVAARDASRRFQAYGNGPLCYVDLRQFAMEIANRADDETLISRASTIIETCSNMSWRVAWNSTLSDSDTLGGLSIYFPIDEFDLGDYDNYFQDNYLLFTSSDSQYWDDFIVNFFDDTNPSCQIISPEEEGWFSSYIWTEASADDDNGVKYVEFQYSLNRYDWYSVPGPDSVDGCDWYGGNGWGLRFQTISTPQHGTISDDKVWVRARSCDNAGRLSDWSESSVAFGVDNTSPVFAAWGNTNNPKPEYYDMYQVVIDSHSGVMEDGVYPRFYYSWNNNEIDELCNDGVCGGVWNGSCYVASINIDNSHIGDILYWAVLASDNAGNKSWSDVRNGGLIQEFLPILSVLPDVIDFGGVEIGFSKDKTFTVYNTGDGILTGSVSVSSPFSIVSGGSYSLSEGQSQEIVVRFSPDSDLSFNTTINFTGGGGAVKSVSGVGYYPPEISVTPNSISFGMIEADTYLDKSFTVKNVGGGVLSGNASANAPFSVASGGSYSLAAGESQSVTIRFSPDAERSYSDSVVFTGGGGLSQTVSGSGYYPPAISVDPESYCYGPVILGNYADKSFNVENTGGSILEGSVSVSAPFSIISGSSYSLSAGQVHNVTIRFNPDLVQEYSVVADFTGGNGDSVALTGNGVVIDPDINRDDFVNIFDFALLSEQWLNSNCIESNHCSGADIDYSGSVEISDLTILAENWLAGEEYTLELFVSGNSIDMGWVECSYDDLTYGSVVQLTATPYDGYRVKSWTGTDDDTSMSNNNTVTMVSDKKVIVEFEKVPTDNLIVFQKGGSPLSDQIHMYKYEDWFFIGLLLNEGVTFQDLHLKITSSPSIGVVPLDGEFPVQCDSGPDLSVDSYYGPVYIDSGALISSDNDVLMTEGSLCLVHSPDDEQIYSYTVKLEIYQPCTVNGYTLPAGTILDEFTLIFDLEQTVVVPDVLGDPLDDARNAITDAGLVVGSITEMFSNIDIGSVCIQEPSAGESVLYGDRVNLVVSKGLDLVTVPNVIGMYIDSAGNALASAGFYVGNVSYIEDYDSPEGMVLDQNPLPGELLLREESVDLLVSLGPPTFSLPDLVGYHMSEAMNLFNTEAADLFIDEVYDPSPAGTVLSQSPGPGDYIYYSPVFLVVSLGPQPIEVPNFVGMSEDLVYYCGLDLDFVISYVYDNAPEFQVIAQDPPAGTMVDGNGAGTVYLTVSVGPQ